jgi:hypothetical protein
MKKNYNYLQFDLNKTQEACPASCPA